MFQSWADPNPTWTKRRLFWRHPFFSTIFQLGGGFGHFFPILFWLFFWGEGDLWNNIFTRSPPSVSCKFFQASSHLRSHFWAPKNRLFLRFQSAPREGELPLYDRGIELPQTWKKQRKTRLAPWPELIRFPWKSPIATKWCNYSMDFGWTMNPEDEGIFLDNVELLRKHQKSTKTITGNNIL